MRVRFENPEGLLPAEPHHRVSVTLRTFQDHVVRMAAAGVWHTGEGRP
jgi:hypothetical protein